MSKFTSMSVPFDSLSVTENSIGRILLVEDDELVADVLSLVLRKAGFTCIWSRTAREGLNIWKTEAGKFHLVITDITLAEGKEAGFILAEQITLETPSAAVVFMSGYSPDDYPDRNLVEGVNFLQKPVRPIDLIELAISHSATVTSDGLAEQTARDIGTATPC